MRSEITWDKVNLECAETAKAIPTVNNSGFINYSNINNFSGIWLDNSGYLITQYIYFKRTGCLMVQKIRNNQESYQGWELSGKYEIFTVEEKRLSLIINRKKRVLEMT